ncbi:MAG: stress-induced morphogen [Lysobacterales bacterium]|jgi:stress-induced morphogen
MTLDDIKNTIEKVVEGSTAYILDPMNDGQHLQAVVVSPSFEGMMLIKQHRSVMNALKDAFGSDTVHALGLKTFTPEKFELERAHFGL